MIKKLRNRLKQKNVRVVLLVLVLLFAAAAVLFFVKSGRDRAYVNETRETLLSTFPVEDVLVTELTGADERVRKTFVIDIGTDFPDEDKVDLEEYLYDRHGSQIFIFYE